MSPILVLVLVLVLIEPIVTKGNGLSKSQLSAIKNVRFRISYTTSTMDTVSVSAWGGGGSSRRTIPSNAAAGPFAGREYGGGDRYTMYGTRAYGSGYPYGADNTTSVAGSPFRIESGPSHGGKVISAAKSPMGVVKLAPGTSHWNGPQPLRRFDPTLPSNHSSSSQPRPENAIQYYRANSFALTYAGYNNTFALDSSNPSTSQSLADSSPLPSQIANSGLLKCINDTIGNALPIADSPDVGKRLSVAAIVGIVIGCGVGVSFFLG
ncbi:hypothetical protein PIIN_05778 [Serendipita indica DSM 11827]|uniref:Uncharacterized protein n=1 Tax=Serendipita indica (strain DSM 11827) TaxID=1109443 RepID=G4TKK0_SERID|nr:hypothetical protein PIIN_05778 [Serendipita indica DSM 11827]